MHVDSTDIATYSGSAGPWRTGQHCRSGEVCIWSSVPLIALSQTDLNSGVEKACLQIGQRINEWTTNIARHQGFSVYRRIGRDCQYCNGYAMERILSECMAESRSPAKERDVGVET